MIGHENKSMLIIMLLLYIVAVVLIGVFNGKSKNSEDYFLASRSLPAWLLAITFIASWWGGGSAIDLVDVAHSKGIGSFWIYGVPVLLSTFLMYLCAGGIRKIGSISQSAMMERRYDGKVALLLSVFIIIFMTIGAAVQVIVIGNFFSSFFAIDYTSAALIGTSTVLFYSLFGGFRGVVLTDLFQFVFFLLSSIFIFVIAYRDSGGFAALNAHVVQSNMEGYTSFFYNVGDYIAYILTFGASWMVQANVWQRISAAKNPKSAKRMMVISFVVFIPLYLLVTLTGMFSHLIYDTVPEGGIVSNMILSLSNPFVSGLVFVGLCSAIMSTMDSMFNTGALVLTIDIFQRRIDSSRNGKFYVSIGRVATLIIGLVSLFIGVKIKSVLTISWIGADFIATGAFVPIVMAFIWKRGTAKAAFITMIYGMLFSTYNLLVALGVNLPVAWEIASATQAIIGIATSFVIFVVASLLTTAENDKAQQFLKDLGFTK